MKSENKNINFGIVIDIEVFQTIYGYEDVVNVLNTIQIETQNSGERQSLLIIGFTD